MRPASLFLLVAIAACLLAQAPMGIGPGGKVDSFDWYAATASGCTAGAGEMCVGGGVNSRPQGDTYYFTGWASDGTVIGSFNDGVSRNCGNNLAVLKLVSFDWSNRNASKIAEVNCMSDYSPNSDAPAGWLRHCTSTDSYADGGCGWKSRAPLVKGGLLYLPVERQIGSGAQSTHDATIIVSADGGATWKNPYTLHHGGATSATGDAPHCDAASYSTPCLAASYPESIMWPAIPMGLADNLAFLQYGKDGSLPTDITDDCNPQVYTCAVWGVGNIGGSIGRVLNTDLPSLDATKWQYVASLDTRYKPTWTSTFSARNPVITFSPFTDSDVARPRGVGGPPVYIKEFHCYLWLGFRYNPDQISFLVSPSPFGPYKQIGNMPGYIGFVTPSLSTGYTVISTNPPHIQVTVITDYKGHSDAGGGVPSFSKYDIVLGPQPYGNGDVPSYLDTGLGRVNSGWQFTAGDVPGTFSRNGLVWAFDFMDHGGVVAGGYPFFHDVANNGAVLYPCFTDVGTVCGVMNNKGLNLLSNGIQVQDGYSARYESNTSDLNTGATAGNQNIPSAMQGNGTFTVAGIFRLDPSSSTGPYWVGGTPSGAGGNQSVGLFNNGGAYSLEWGAPGVVGGYHYLSAFSPTVSSWYFVSAVVTAGAPNPAASMWVGQSGALVNVLSGVSRTSTGGTQTPAVAAGPLVLGFSGGYHTISASYGGLLVYNRALSKLDCDMLYQSFKAKMKDRGITLQ